MLFLVDTRSLGAQARQEFLSFTPNDDNRRFTEFYSAQRLASSHVHADAQDCTSASKRMYWILQGSELDASAEHFTDRRREPLHVASHAKVPPRFCDRLIYECQRAISNLWRQVLDAFLVGRDAAPHARTHGFFRQNIMSESPHEDAVADGVHVQGEIYTIETAVSQRGGTVLKGFVEKRKQRTRAKRWSQQQNERELDAASKRSEAQRQSILKRTLTGCLVPRDPAEEPFFTRLRTAAKAGARARQPRSDRSVRSVRSV